jgi:hypothetical protein
VDRQDTPSPTFHLGAGANGATRKAGGGERKKPPRPARTAHPWLPGMEIE